MTRDYFPSGSRRGDGTFLKDPDEVLDFTIQYELNGSSGDYLFRNSADQIASSTWTIPSGITQDSSSNTAQSATVWLSGGTNGQSYECKNRITTTGGRTLERSIRIRVKQR